MLPAYAHVTAIAVRKRFKHANRKHLGDPTQRALCCDPLPAEYPFKKAVADIPELSNKLEPVSITNTGYTHWFGCRLSGKE